MFSFCQWNLSKKKKKLTLGYNSKKADGIDTIPPKLTKLAVDFLNPFLTRFISSSIEHNIFPDLAKTVLVVPLDERKPIESDISVFRPLSISDAFSKVWERVKTNQLFRGMKNVFAPQMSANRKIYNSHHVFIRLIEKWREHLDKDFVIVAMLNTYWKPLSLFRRAFWLLNFKLMVYMKKRCPTFVHISQTEMNVLL